MLTSDNGNTGAGPAGGLTDTETATIAVAAVNDAPVNTVPGDQTVRPNSTKPVPGISVADIDAGNLDMRVTLSVNNGILAVAPTSGVTAIGSGTANISLQGPQSLINAALASLQYSPNPFFFNATDVLTVVSNDLGNVGAGGALTATSTVNLIVPLPPLNLVSNIGAGTAKGITPQVTTFNAAGTKLGTTDPGFAAGFTNGVRVAEADVNGDGVADIVVGTGPGIKTLVRVIDGKTGVELFRTQPFEDSFTGGVFVAAGDVNADGKADIVVTPDEGGGPHVVVYDGATFNVIASVNGIDDTNFRGGVRAAVADMNVDGYGDLLVTAGFGGGPRVAGFDGKSLFVGVTENGVTTKSLNRLFNDFFVFEDSVRNGVFIAAGDVNGDGYADLILGGGPDSGPRVAVLSGRALIQGSNLTLLANFFAGDKALRGGVPVAAKNVNNDPYADIVTGSGIAEGSKIRVYAGAPASSGGEYNEINEFDSYPGFTNGVFVG